MTIQISFDLVEVYTQTKNITSYNRDNTILYTIQDKP